MDKLTQDKIDLLRAAHNIITRRQKKYICIAIHLAREMGVGTDLASLQLCLYIERRLAGCGVLEEWLRVNGVPDHSLDPDKRQRTRLAWIDAMIRSLETGEEVRR